MANIFTNKFFIKHNKNLQKFLSRFQNDDLVFVKNHQFDGGLFSGYLFDNKPFYGEVRKDRRYLFGFFDEKGEPALMTLDVNIAEGSYTYGYKDKGETITVDSNGNIDSYIIKRGVLKKHIKSAKVSAYDMFYQKTDEEFLSNILPPVIKNVRLVKNKNMVFYGEVVNKKHPEGYGILFHSSKKHGEKNAYTLIGSFASYYGFDSLLKENEPFFAIEYTKYRSANSYSCEFHIGFGKTDLRIDDSLVFNVKINKINNKQQVFIPFNHQYYDWLMTIYYHYKYDYKYVCLDYGLVEDKTENVNYEKPFVFDETMIPTQATLATLSAFKKGDASFFEQMFSMIPDSSLFMPRKKWMELLTSGDASSLETAIEKYTDEVNEKKRQEEEEQRRLEEEEKERKREEARLARQRRKEAKEAREREERRRQEELRKREEEKRNAELEKRRVERANKDYSNTNYSSWTIQTLKDDNKFPTPQRKMEGIYSSFLEGVYKEVMEECNRVLYNDRKRNYVEDHKGDSYGIYRGFSRASYDAIKMKLINPNDVEDGIEVYFSFNYNGYRHTFTYNSRDPSRRDLERQKRAAETNASIDQQYAQTVAIKAIKNIMYRNPNQHPPIVRFYVKVMLD